PGPDRDLAAGRPADPRGRGALVVEPDQRGRVPLLVEHRDARVRRAEIDADDAPAAPRHLALLLPHEAGQEALALVGGLPPHVRELAGGAFVGRIDLERGLEPLRGLEPVSLPERGEPLAQLDARAKRA